MLCFQKNLHQIEKLNQPYEADAAVFGVTKFSDLSQEEFKGNTICIYYKDI